MLAAYLWCSAVTALQTKKRRLWDLFAKLAAGQPREMAAGSYESDPQIPATRALRPYLIQKMLF